MKLIKELRKLKDDYSRVKRETERVTNDAKILYQMVDLGDILPEEQLKLVDQSYRVYKKEQKSLEEARKHVISLQEKIQIDRTTSILLNEIAFLAGLIGVFVLFFTKLPLVGVMLVFATMIANCVSKNAILNHNGIEAMRNLCTTSILEQYKDGLTMKERGKHKMVECYLTVVERELEMQEDDLIAKQLFELKKYEKTPAPVIRIEDEIAYYSQKEQPQDVVYVEPSDVLVAQLFEYQERKTTYQEETPKIYRK